jgi:hypothetical protein
MVSQIEINQLDTRKDELRRKITEFSDFIEDNPIKSALSINGRKT